MKIKGTVESVTPMKTGVSPTTGKEWTRFEVIISGEKYSTFDAQYKNYIGKSGEFEVKIEDRVSARGTAYKSRTLVNLPRASQASPQIMEFLKRIEGKLDELLKMNYEVEKEDVEPTDEQLPF